jgi:hypothetical protein
MEYPTAPDEVEVAINFLASHAKILAFAPVIVAGDLKGFVAPMRWITVMTTGGTEDIPVRLFAPRVDINVYAETKPVAKRLMLAASAALKSMRNHMTADAVVTGVEMSTPADLTDPVNNNPRFTADATIHIRPRAGG